MFTVFCLLFLMGDSAQQNWDIQNVNIDQYIRFCRRINAVAAYHYYELYKTHNSTVLSSMIRKFNHFIFK